MSARLLIKHEAAAYCGMSEPHFDAHIAAHVPPLAFGARRLWDRAAIDRHIDRLSGLGQTATSPQEWLEKIADRPSQGRKGRPR